MPSRFTTTEKWNDRHFYNLSPIAKLLFVYICDNCNLAGFLEINEKRIASDIGCSPDQIESALEDLTHSIVLRNGIVWVKKFIIHQNNFPLVFTAPPHKGVLKCFRPYYKQFLEDSEFRCFWDGLGENEKGYITLSKGFENPIGKGKGKDSLSFKEGLGENFLSAESCARLLRDGRGTDKEPGRVTKFEEGWIRALCLEHTPEKVQDSIKEVLARGWHGTKDQIILGIKGKLPHNGKDTNGKTSYERRLNFDAKQSAADTQRLIADIGKVTSGG